MKVPAIAVTGLWVRRDGHPVLADVSFRLATGRWAILLGPNGSGKTTLLRTLVGLERPWRGEVALWGRRPREARRRVGYVPQTITVDPAFPVTVREVVVSGTLWGRGGDADQVERLVDTLGLGELLDRRFGELSGGEQRRVLVARALASDPDLVLLDEPTAGLDPHYVDRLFRALDREPRRTVLMATHDLGALPPRIDLVLCLNRTLAVHEATDGGFDVTQLSDLYGEGWRPVLHGPVEHLHGHMDPSESCRR